MIKIFAFVFLQILECELCKLAVLAVDKLIKKNRSSSAINETLEEFCNSLPGEAGDLVSTRN